MSKFKAIFSHGGGSTPTTIGTYKSLDEAANASWDYASRNGHTRSNCESRESVVEALCTRMFCMLAYGPYEIEIEEIN